MKLCMILISFFFAASSLHAESRKTGSSTYLEIAPLKGAYGQLSARAEFRLFPRLAMATYAESLSKEGERDDYADKETNIGAEALFYPWESTGGSVFIGAGLKTQQINTGRSRRRNTHTWVRMLGDEQYDYWVDQGDYVCTTQTIGYRLHASNWWTASVRLASDQILRKTMKTKKESLYGDSDPIEPMGRKRSSSQIVMHVGLVLP